MIRHPAQSDLLAWTPPEPVARYEPERVRAAALAHRISRAVSETLRDCGETRETIAERMSEFLEQRISVDMLNAYASPAREDHPISLVRFAALMQATRDRRLLQLLADLMGWAVVEGEHLPLIELAQIQERQNQLEKRAKQLRAVAKARGTL